ncbi:MAG: glycosyltransferase family 4 protein [Candidatus Latescibacterota bacterium]
MGEGAPRVLVFAMAFPPAAVGTGIYAQRLACGLAGKGAEVVVLAPGQGAPGAADFDRRQPYRVLRLSLPRCVPARYWAGRRALRRALHALRPDSLWTTNGMATRVAGLLPELGGGGPAVVSCMRGSDVVTRLPGRGLWARLESIPQRRCYRISAAIAAASQYLKEVAVARGVDGARIFVNPPVFDFSELEQYAHDPERLCARHPFLRGRRIVLTVARLVEQKRVGLAVRAFAACAGADADLCHVIVGDGPQRRRLQAEAAQAGVGDRVFLLGTVPPMSQELHDLYSAAEVFLMLGVREGMGNVYAEAGAFGLPALGVADGGVPEVVRHGHTGLLAAPDDSAGAAALLARLLGDPQERRRLGAQAREWVRQTFSTQAMAERSWRVLSRVLNGQPP